MSNARIYWPTFYGAVAALLVTLVSFLVLKNTVVTMVSGVLVLVLIVASYVVGILRDRNGTSVARRDQPIYAGDFSEPEVPVFGPYAARVSQKSSDKAAIVEVGVPVDKKAARAMKKEEKRRLAEEAKFQKQAMREAAKAAKNAAVTPAAEDVTAALLADAAASFAKENPDLVSGKTDGDVSVDGVSEAPSNPFEPTAESSASPFWEKEASAGFGEAAAAVDIVGSSGEDDGKEVVSAEQIFVSPGIPLSEDVDSVSEIVVDLPSPFSPEWLNETPSDYRVPENNISVSHSVGLRVPQKPSLSSVSEAALGEETHDGLVSEPVETSDSGDVGSFGEAAQNVEDEGEGEMDVKKESVVVDSSPVDSDDNDEVAGIGVRSAMNDALNVSAAEDDENHDLVDESHENVTNPNNLQEENEEEIMEGDEREGVEGLEEEDVHAVPASVGHTDPHKENESGKGDSSDNSDNSDSSDESDNRKPLLADDDDSVPRLATPGTYPTNEENEEGTSSMTTKVTAKEKSLAVANGTEIDVTENGENAYPVLVSDSKVASIATQIAALVAEAEQMANQIAEKRIAEIRAEAESSIQEVREEAKQEIASTKEAANKEIKKIESRIEAEKKTAEAEKEALIAQHERELETKVDVTEFETVVTQKERLSENLDEAEANLTRVLEAQKTVADAATTSSRLQAVSRLRKIRDQVVGQPDNEDLLATIDAAIDEFRAI